jgi:hypothetical protein
MADGRFGNIGLCSFTLKEKNFTAEELASWFENDLAPLLSPYPAPRSIVLIDNMPEHRRWDIFPRIRAAVHGRGAILICNPPQSPDLNPIEKFWDVSLAACRRRIIDLLVGTEGAPRKFSLGDLILILQRTRMTDASYHFIKTRV